MARSCGDADQFYTGLVLEMFNVVPCGLLTWAATSVAPASTGHGSLKLAVQRNYPLASAALARQFALTSCGNVVSETDAGDQLDGLVHLIKYFKTSHPAA